jgi:hypothetical protein
MVASMARMLSNPRRRVLMNWRRLSRYRASYRKNALPGSETEIAVPRSEEGPRVLTGLITATQRTIDQSRALIAKIDELLTKRR